MTRNGFSPFWIFLLRSNSSLILSFHCEVAVVSFPGIWKGANWEHLKAGTREGFLRAPGSTAQAVTVLHRNVTTAQHPILSPLRPHPCASPTSGPQIKSFAIFKDGFLSFFRSGPHLIGNMMSSPSLKPEVSLLSSFCTISLHPIVLSTPQRELNWAESLNLLL